MFFQTFSILYIAGKQVYKQKRFWKEKIHFSLYLTMLEQNCTKKCPVTEKNNSSPNLTIKRKEKIK